MKTPHDVFLHHISKSIVMHVKDRGDDQLKFPSEIFLTLTYKLELDNHPLDLHTKNSSQYVCPYTSESET